MPDFGVVSSKNPLTEIVGPLMQHFEANACRYWLPQQKAKTKESQAMNASER